MAPGRVRPRLGRAAQPGQSEVSLLSQSCTAVLSRSPGGPRLCHKVPAAPSIPARLAGPAASPWSEICAGPRARASEATQLDGVELERPMQHPHRLLHPLAVDDAGDADIRRADHVDVDVRLG